MGMSPHGRSFSTSKDKLPDRCAVSSFQLLRFFANGGKDSENIVDFDAAMDPDDRLTNISEDNHQPWLWFTHIFCLIFVGSAVALRGYIKRSQYGKEDTVLLVGHVSNSH